MASIIGYIPAATNYMYNPSAENGAISMGYCGAGAGITSPVSTWITAQQNNAWDGNWSTRVVIPNANVASADQYILCTLLTNANSGFDFTAGKEYSFGVYWKKAQASLQPYISILWMNAASQSVGHPTQAIPTVFTPADMNNWSLLKFEGIEVPATATQCYFYVRLRTNGASGGGTIHLDGFQAVNLPDLPVFISGAQGPGYVWAGAANASRSIRNAQPIYGASGRRGIILMEPQLYKADKLGNAGTEISKSILSGSVEMRTDREIKMQFKGTLHGLNPVASYTDYLMPVLKLSFPDGKVVQEPIGLYSIAPPGEEWNEEYVTGSFQGYDPTWNLAQSSFGVPFTVAAGTNVVQSMRNILNNEGFTKWNIPDDGAVFATARTWETTASKLAILNDHAEAIAYYTLHVDRYGSFQSYPYIDLDNAEPAVLLFSGAGSNVIGAIKREKSTEGIVNMVRVLREGAADGTISYTQTNSNPLSNTSTIKMGRTIFKEIKIKNLTSLSVAQRHARKALRDAASLYTRYTIQTIPDPTRNVWEIYDTLIYMNDGTEVISGKVRAIGWDIGFTPSSAVMTHHVARNEPYE